MKKVVTFLAVVVLVGGLWAGYARANGFLFPDEEKSPLNLKEEKKIEKPKALQEQVKTVKKETPKEEVKKKGEVGKLKEIRKKVLPWVKRERVKKAKEEEKKNILQEYNEQVERKERQKNKWQKKEEKAPLFIEVTPTFDKEHAVENELIGVQKEIAIVNKKNELKKLNLESTKIDLEQKKIIDEMRTPSGISVEEQEKKQQETQGAQRGRYPYSSTPSATTPITLPREDLSVLMVSSSREGTRALVREASKTFYVQIGSKIRRGRIIAITPQGITIDEGESVKFYPTSSP